MVVLRHSLENNGRSSTRIVDGVAWRLIDALPMRYQMESSAAGEKEILHDEPPCAFPRFSFFTPVAMSFMSAARAVSRAPRTTRSLAFHVPGLVYRHQVVAPAMSSMPPLTHDRTRLQFHHAPAPGHAPARRPRTCTLRGRLDL